MPIKWSVIFLIFFLVGSAKTFADLKQETQEIYYSFDKQKYIELIEKYESKVSTDLDKYCLSLLYHNIGKIVYNLEPDEAINAFEKSVSYIEKIKNYEDRAEYLALLSASYGKISSLKPLTAIYWGIKAKKTILQAYDIAPENRKVLLIASVHLMHTPKSFGGDKQQAESFLRKSLKLSTETDLLDWAGDAEIFAYLAQLEILKNNIPQSQKFIKKALNLESQYGFVLHDLIPQIEKIESKK